MAAFRTVDDVLKQLVEIFEFRHAKTSENISEEMLLLRQQCQKFIADEKMRLVKSGIENIVVRKCEFSKLQFPKSQLERSAQARIQEKI